MKPSMVVVPLLLLSRFELKVMLEVAIAEAVGVATEGADTGSDVVVTVRSGDEVPVPALLVANAWKW